MNKFLQILVLFLSVGIISRAQTDEGYVLKGNPVITDGWQLTGTAAVNSDEIVLVDATQTGSGSIYFDAVRQLYKCSEFRVSFRMRVNNSMANNPGDGIAFWFANNFVPGVTPFNPLSSGIGLPSNMTGFAAVIDVFDNDANSNNPLISLRNFTNGNYVEGSATGLIAEAVNPNIPNLANGAWHEVLVIYANGTVSVSINGGVPVINAVPAAGMTNAFQGYFGFSAANGTGNASRLAIKDVVVASFPLPPKVIVPTFCLDQPAASFVYPNAGDVIWYNSLTAPDNSGTTFAPTINITGLDTFTYYVSSRNANFCYGERMKIDAIIHQSPEAEFSFIKSEGCGADTIYFTNESTDANFYTWDFNDGFNSIAQDPMHVFEGEGSYNVLLIAMNDYCIDSVRHLIELENPFLVDFRISDDSICQGETITFLNLSKIMPKHGIDPAYFWDFGTANAWDTSNLKNPPALTYYEPGTYEIMLIGSNAIPCTDTVYKYLVVDPKTEVSFTRSDTSICLGDEVVFKGSVSEGGLVNYTWSFGDGSTQITDIDELSRSFDAPGIYDITLAADYRVCADSSYTKKITVHGLPTLYLGADTSLCQGGEAIVIADNTNGLNPNAKWLWNTGDTTASILVTDIGVYRAQVTINGCSTSDDIEVKKNCYIDIPNAFSPDGDGINDYFFPRSMAIQNIASFKMVIYNRWGQVVYETVRPEGRGWDGNLNGEALPFGVYVYQIEVTFQNERAEKYSGNVTLLR